MANLKGSKTEGNLKAAFAGESQANRRYLYFAQKADVEGYNDVAAVFRSTAEGETGHAHGHLEFLEASRRPGDRPADRRAPQPTSRPRSPARRTNTPTCIRAWRARPARKASTRSPTGSRRSPRPRRATPAASRRRSTRWPEDARYGARRGPRSGRPFSSDPTSSEANHARRQPRRPVPSSHRLAEPDGSRRGRAREGDGAGLRHLSRLPALLQSVRQLPAAVRHDRRGPDRRARRRAEGATTPRSSEACTLCDMCFMTKCPYVPPHPFERRLPAPDAAPPRGQANARRASASSRAAGRDRPQRQARHAARRPGQLGDRRRRTRRCATRWRRSPASITARACRSRPPRPSSALAHREPVPLNPRGARLRPAQGGALCHLLRRLSTTPTSAGDARGAGQAGRRDRGRLSRLLRHAAARGGRPRDGRRAARSRWPTRSRRWIDEGYDVVALTASCGLMMKFEWPLILPERPRRSSGCRAATRDISEYVVDIAKKHGLRRGLKPVDGRRHPAPRLPRAGAEHGAEVAPRCCG